MTTCCPSPLEMSRRKITCPILVEASELLDDEFWADILAKCGAGKFPVGFNYYNNVLSFKRESIPLTGDPYEVGLACIAFLKKYAGIHSPDELERIIEMSRSTSRERIKCTIKTSPRRNIMIDDYIEKHYPDVEDKDRLFTIILLGILTNSINVVYDGKNIVSVQGVTTDDGIKIS